MKKWTVRVEDEMAEKYARWCASQGISIQAAMEFGIQNTVSLISASGNRYLLPLEAGLIAPV
jgi:hypothetical protein